MVRAMDNSTTEDSRSRAVESQVLKCGVKDWCHAHIGMDWGEQSQSRKVWSNRPAHRERAVRLRMHVRGQPSCTYTYHHFIIIIYYNTPQ